jgi:hypothetical protein
VNRFQFVDDHQRHHGVKRLCQVIGIARSSYYHWKATAPDRAVRGRVLPSVRPTQRVTRLKVCEALREQNLRRQPFRLRLAVRPFVEPVPGFIPPHPHSVRVTATSVVARSGLIQTTAALGVHLYEPWSKFTDLWTQRVNNVQPRRGHCLIPWATALGAGSPIDRTTGKIVLGHACRASGHRSHLCQVIVDFGLWLVVAAGRVPSTSDNLRGTIPFTRSSAH